MTQTTMKKFTKTVTSHAVSTHDTLGARESTALTLNQEAVATLMFTLTDLYSDPYMAVLREYTTNAHDSHKKAKQKRPVEVTLPSFTSPSFTVKDYGVGMSKSDLQDIYAQYGNSTKRDDMNQVGAYGLGCKSALALVDQFTINAVQDGKRTIAVMSRNDSGGKLDILEQSDTDEQNGVTVTIPIPNAGKFNTNVETFFSTWNPKSVLVNGAAPTKSIYDGSYYRHKNILVKPTRGYNSKVTFIIEGFAYQIKHELAHFNTGRSLNNVSTDIFVELPVGLVDFTPAREALRYTERVNSLIKETIDYLKTNIHSIAYADIAASETRWDALNKAYAWRVSDDVERVTPPVWKGDNVITKIDLKVGRPTLSSESGTNRFKRDSGRFIPLVVGDNVKTYIITGAQPVSDAYMTRVVKSEFDLNDASDSHINVFFLEEENIIKNNPWVQENDGIMVANAQEIYDKYKKEQAEYRLANPTAKRAYKASPVDTLEYRAYTFVDGKMAVAAKTLSDWAKEDTVDASYYVTSTSITGTPWLGARWVSNTSEAIRAFESAAPSVVSLVGEGKKVRVYLIEAPRRSEAFIRRYESTNGETIENLFKVAGAKMESLTKGITDATRGLMSQNYKGLTNLMKSLSRASVKLLPEDMRKTVKFLTKNPASDSNILVNYITSGNYDYNRRIERAAKSAVMELDARYPLVSIIGNACRYEGATTVAGYAKEIDTYMLAK